MSDVIDTAISALRDKDTSEFDGRAKFVIEGAGTIMLDETEKKTAKKVMRAVTDSGSEVRAGEDKPGVTNLLDLLSAVTGREIPDLEADFEGKMYGDFKKAVAEGVNEFLRPARERHAELSKDPAELDRLLAIGADRARNIAETTMDTVRDRVGFLPPA